MTREEAQAKALSMPRIQALVSFRNDVIDREWTGIDILFPSGQKAGVGNPRAIELVKRTMLEELDRQILECEGGDIVEIHCYDAVERMNRKDAIAKYRECMAGSEGSERDRYLNIYLDLTNGKKVCYDEH